MEPFQATISSGDILIGTVLIMFLAGLIFVWSILKRTNQGFGPNSARVLGIVFFLPVLLFAIGYENFPGEAIAALLGTLAGYVFSSGTKGSDSDK